MNREIKVERDIRDIGFNTTSARKIIVEEGITVITGCNGAGKSTLILNINEKLREAKIPCYMYDDRKDGGLSLMSQWIAGFGGSLDNAVMTMMSSESERTIQNIFYRGGLIKQFLKTGRCSGSNFDWDRKEIESNERWLLFDSTDSGMNIEHIALLKSWFQQFIDEGKELGVHVFIVISSNTFELSKGEDCIDAMSGKHKTFKTYNGYRNYILKCYKKKVERLERARKKNDRDED